MNILRLTLPGTRAGLMACAATFCIAVLLSGSFDRAEADVEVTGSFDSVRLDAREATISEVLDALGASFSLTYRGADQLARPISGTFEGSLPQVVSSILQGHDFAMRAAADHVEVFWVKATAPGQGSGVSAEAPDQPRQSDEQETSVRSNPGGPPEINRPAPGWRLFAAKSWAKHMPDRSAKAYSVGKFNPFRRARQPW